MKEDDSSAKCSEELYQKALDWVRSTGRVSVVQLQIRLGVGFFTAERLMEMMEERGVFGPEMRSQWLRGTGFSVRQSTPKGSPSVE